MNMIEAVKHVFTNYANFKGRARRSEYWWFVLFGVIVSAVLSVFAKKTPMEYAGQMIMVSQNKVLSLYNLIAFIPTLAVIVRRLHDIGKSGWCYLWILLPIAGWIMVIVWLAREGERGENRFGADPKAPADVPWQY